MSFESKILESAQEGIVLIKNEGNVLPLKNESISIFGRSQFDFYRCGTGSGGSVHISYATNLTDSLMDLSKEFGLTINTELAQLYRDFIKENPFDVGEGWAAEPYSQKELELTDDLVKKCSEFSSKAVYVVGRTAGEDKDYKKEKGSWYLSELEEKNIELLCSNFKEVVIVFNTSGVIHTNWINDAKYNGKIKAALYAWQGGQEAGRACATILCGKAIPSGKLSDTIAFDIEDYASTKNFGGTEVYYEEDIFTGYRYFTTFAKDKILYPFGYGLSYTTFELVESKASFNNDTLHFSAKIKNTGNEYCGKQVIELYVSVKNSVLSRPEKVLCGYAKTDEIACGATEEVCFDIKLNELASYDDSGVTGNPYCWIIEKGDYYFSCGFDSEKTVCVDIDGKECISVFENKVIEKLEQACAPVKPFKRLCNKNGKAEYENVPLSKVDLAKRIDSMMPKEIPFTGDKGIKFDMVKKDPSLMDAFVGQLDIKQLCTIVRGEGMMSRKVTPGIAAAFGGTSESLHEYGIPCAGCADGPSGIRLDNGKGANLMPIGTQLACTWNDSLIYDLYKEEGKELAQNEIDALLGPGINIHRNPLNGRNFEYFSEDPYLTSRFTVAQVKGLFDGGSNGTIKHLALNSQETSRRVYDSIVSERALREIYLKPFECAVKEANVKSIMTSYNSINGHWAASNFDLVNTILHKQWNYTGMVMTDWWADMNHCVDGGKESIKFLNYMVRARNDIYMVVDNDGAECNVFGDNLEESLKDGSLNLSELQLCVKDILKFVMEAPVSKRPLRALVNIAVFDPCSENDPVKNETLIEFNKDFVPEEGKSYVLKVTEKCNVNIAGVMCKVEDTVSQSVTNIFINGNDAASFECRSTLGKDVFVTASKVCLVPGKYIVTMKNIKKGIELKSLMLSNKEFSPVSAGIFS